jgi:hypothetical protein
MSVQSHPSIHRPTVYPHIHLSVSLPSIFPIIPFDRLVGIHGSKGGSVVPVTMGEKCPGVMKPLCPLFAYPGSCVSVPAGRRILYCRFHTVFTAGVPNIATTTAAGKRRKILLHERHIATEAPHMALHLKMPCWGSSVKRFSCVLNRKKNTYKLISSKPLQ